MSSWHEFITMGGYGAYVWPAYGITLLVMLVNAIEPSRRQHRLLQRLRRRVRHEGQKS